MKKLLLVLAIGAFAACGDSGSGDTTTTDSTTTMSSDSTVVAPVMPSDTGSMTTDSTMKDSTKM